jgi:hypothetical protein
MSIDIDSEELIHLPAARALFPQRPAVNTLHRWRLKGVRGVKLETVLIGALRYTSREACRRFIAAQNAGDPGNKPDPAAASRRAKEAGRALEKIGA